MSSFDRISNSWLYRLGEAIADVVLFSCLFLLFSLPVVTIGPSLCALYYIVYNKYTKGGDPNSKDFVRSFRSNLKNGIVVHLICSVFSLIVGFNIYFAFAGFGDLRLPDWYPVVSLLPLLPLIFTMPYVYALLARFDNGIKGTITNSFILCMVNFPRFLLIWLVVIVALAICIFFPPAALIVPVGATYLIQMVTEKSFAKALSVEQQRKEEVSDKDSEEDPDGRDRS